MKRGFTLIELLAVIVILAIIALIATPIVIDIISDTKASALLRSAEFYLDGVEFSIANAKLNNRTIKDGVYNILETGNICLEDYDETTKECKDKDSDAKNNELKVEVNGDKPSSGTITITNGEISDISLNLGNKDIVKNEKGELVYQEENDPIKLCTANTTKANVLVWKGSADPALESSYAEEEVGFLASTDGAYTPGVAYTCNFIDDSEENNMTFYVLSSTEDTVTLISGANLDGTVAWSSDGSNHKDETEDKQAVTAKAALAERTSNWSSANVGKLSEEQMLTIKLPTAYQIAEAVGQTFSGSSISGLPTWLTSHAKAPVSYGYWTSTPFAGSSTDAWHVSYYGAVDYSLANDRSNSGLRPVITISKSNI